jgi:hypothetical protein
MTTALERPPARDLDTLATEIRDHHEAAQAAFRTSIEEAVLCGEKLIEAKAQLPHGGWLPWLERNFPASARTAQGYMRLARCEDAQALAHLGVEAALKQLAAPKDDEREADEPADELAELRQLEHVVGDGLSDLRWRFCCLYNRRAHTALGYSTWEDFARAEFGPASDQWPEPIAGMMLDEAIAVGAGDPVIALPPLDAATEAALRESIRRFGVLVPVVKDQHGRLLDGYYRSRIARELGLDYRVYVITVSSDEEACEMALSLNDDRSQRCTREQAP